MSNQGVFDKVKVDKQRIDEAIQKAKEMIDKDNILECQLTECILNVSQSNEIMYNIYLKSDNCENIDMVEIPWE